MNTFIGALPIFLNLGLRQAFGLDYFHINNQTRKIILSDIIYTYLICCLPILILYFLNLKNINNYVSLT